VGTLCALLILTAAVLSFTQIADAIASGAARNFDRRIMLALRDPTNPASPLGPPWLEEAARDVTSLGSTAVLALVSVGVIGFLVLSYARAAAVLVATSVGGGSILLNLLKGFFARPRPDIVPHAVPVFTASFPSGHAALSAVTYLTLGALLARVQPNRRLKAYLLGAAVTLTLLIGITRVYLGVHWPTDVLAGWCIGAAWAIACWLAAVWLQRHGQVEHEMS
jgi:undecaprenyl-diphosphatase